MSVVAAMRTCEIVKRSRIAIVKRNGIAIGTTTDTETGTAVTVTVATTPTISTPITTANAPEPDMALVHSQGRTFF